MTKHWKYLLYLLRHKWYVLVECWKRGLYWRGITHDVSKFLPSEWFPYVHYFYGDFPDHTKCSAAFKYEYTGKYKCDIERQFDFAWLLHQKRNRHHWQWWILPLDDGGTTVLSMTARDAVEMLCDWIGAGKAQGNPDTRAWYEKNRDKIVLHPAVRAWIEKELIL